MAAPDIPAAKRNGLPVDLERLAAEGDGRLTPEDRYALKTRGVCTQLKDGLFMVRVRIPGGVLPCPNSCAQHQAGDIGLGGTKVRLGGKVRTGGTRQGPRRLIRPRPDPRPPAPRPGAIPCPCPTERSARPGGPRRLRSLATVTSTVWGSPPPQSDLSRSTLSRVRPGRSASAANTSRSLGLREIVRSPTTAVPPWRTTSTPPRRNVVVVPPMSRTTAWSTAPRRARFGWATLPTPGEAAVAAHTGPTQQGHLFVGPAVGGDPDREAVEGCEHPRSVAAPRFLPVAGA